MANRVDGSYAGKILMSNSRPDHVDMRRRDRAVYDETWIESFLARAPVCVIATAVNNQPFANANTFVYDRETKALYCHTARTGTLRSNIEANPAVCVIVFSMGRLLPADTAKELSVEYDSVVAYGRAGIVSDQAEMRSALEGLAKKYFPHLVPGEDYRALTATEASQTTVYRIEIERWSGKRKVADRESPDAFHFGEREAGQDGPGS